MWQDLLIAFSLVLVIEGIMPFISPAGWRSMVLGVARGSDKHIRVVGLISMVAGLALLYWVR